MPYKPVDDVTGIEESSVDAKELDPMMYAVVEAVRFALKSQSNFKKTIPLPTDESALISILRSQLLLYKTTHRSLRLILANAYDEQEHWLVPDATSLVREQLEKIFIVSLFLDNPRKWILQYSRTAWRNDFERFRLETEEYGDLDRHQEFLTKHFPAYLTKIQKIQIGNRTEVIVSDFARRALEYRWNNPSEERPRWFVSAQKRKKRKYSRLRDYIKNYFDFPTPGRAAAVITDKQRKEFLYRWHKDYSNVCQYSHVLFGKILIPTMSEYKDWQHAEKTEFNGKKLAEQTIFWSMISCATSCALMVNALKNNYGSKDMVKDFWKTLYESSLAGKGYWEMYIKSILK